MTLQLGTRLKLALVLVVLAGASQWVSYRVSRDALEATVREREIDKVKTVSRVGLGLIQQQSQRVQLVAQLLANQDELARAMERRSPEDRVRAAAMLGEAHQQSGVDAIELIDLQETVVYRALEPKRFGDRSLAWGVAEALGGQRVLTSTSGALGATVLATEPLRRGDRVVGAVSVGLRFDQRLIKTLSTEVGAELALLPRSGKAVVSNVALVERVDALATTEAFLTKIPVYRQGSGDGHTRAYVPMLIVDDAYVMVVEVDSTAAYAALTQSSRRSAVYAAAIMMASIVLGLLTLHYLLAPLRRLRKRAERTAVELTGANIQARQSDEVAAVVEVLDTLTERLVRRNRELADAIVAADAASEAKSRFLSTMSHEIRTPLNGVLGMSELLQYTRLDTEQARYAGAIAAAGRALHDLLGDILDLAKIEEGRIEIDRVDFEPAHRLAEIGALYRELSQARGVALLTEFDPAAAVYVSGDPIRFRQVLANLLGNAVKFTERGSITLRSQRIESPAGDPRVWLRISLRDSGVGIAPEVMSRLFQRFVQADASTTREFGGSGLGLAISRHLVELMGGAIHAESRPGVGSTFWFELPFDAPSTPAPPVPVGSPVRLTGRVRVLVAEDNEVNQQVIVALLTRLGAAVSVVENGALAVEALHREAFGLVLMDCQMPVMDGYEASARIRAAQGSGARVPIIALTANALVADRERCVEAGMDDYLTKPVSLASLRTALRRWWPEVESVADPAPGAAPVPAPEESVAAIDPAAVNQLVGQVGATNVARIMRLFIDTAVARRAAMADSAARRDLKQLREALHKVHPSSASLGGVAFARQASAAEHRAEQGDDEVLTVIPQLLADFDALCEAFVQHPLLRSAA